MTKTLKFFCLAMVAMVTSLGFVACSDDDDSSIVFYSMGFDSTSFSGGSLEEMSNELGTIENAYKNAIGVSDASFTMDGSSSSCDKKVKAACEKAVSALQGKTFKGTYVFSVKNQNENTTIHSHEY